jgi:Putative inner membrane protein (DUF1819)
MTLTERYTTNLSKAQGIIPETYELLELWQPGMTGVELKKHVKETGALGKPSHVRMEDIVIRGFARRYLVRDSKPALWLKRLIACGASRACLRQLMLIYTARANPIFHDFIRKVYWRKSHTATRDIGKLDARDFLEHAIGLGRIDPPWSEEMRERVARYLLGTLEDFELTEEIKGGRRRVRPAPILPQTVVFLAYELHLSGESEEQIPKHADWRLFGLMPADVIRLLEICAAQGHLFLQQSGAILRIEWFYKDMKDVIDAIAH